MIIRQTQQVHEQVADLLTQVRRLRDVQIVYSITCVTSDSPTPLLELEPERTMIALKPVTARQLLRSVSRRKDVQTVASPKVTVFNGQSLELDLGVGRFTLQATVSADRRSVTLAFLSDDPGTSGQLLVGDNQPVAIGLAGMPKDRQTLVLVQPRIIIHEEEEEQRADLSKLAE